jgi:hypothetical protein
MKDCKVCKVTKAVVKTTAIAGGALFAVYMWNLDQKLLSWAYIKVNDIFDRKKEDIKF